MAWTPPSRPDTIVLFGGKSLYSTLLNAETVPGSTFEIINQHCKQCKGYLMSLLF